jgi:hypothetical protein
MDKHLGENSMMPDRIGRYKIIARLGKGAMGIVYRAADTETGQEVALKVIAPELAFDHEMLERFQREGESLRQLHHPNIVGFVGMFESDGQHVIALEYVPGGSLFALIKQGPLSLDHVRRMALELCDALTRAHHLNIIHRDLKPENVLLTADGTPKLTDFGVARLVGEGTRLTGTGAQVGTPYYMAPEAWEGQPLDAQADIWALGVVLYEMLAGEVPFGGNTLVAVMNQVLNAPLPDLKAKRADVPEGLAQIVQRMLHRDKAGRYQSMREVAADLEKGYPAAPRPAATRKAAQPSGPPARPRPWRVFVGGGAALLILAPMVFMSLQLQIGQSSLHGTATALWQLGQAATQAAGRPTDTPIPTITPQPTATLAASATLDALALATQIQGAIQTQNANQTATQAIQVTYVGETQAAQATILALTPSATPTITLTPSKTPVPLPTSTPAPTSTRRPIVTGINFGGNKCTPSRARAGVIVVIWPGGVNPYADFDTVSAALGDSAATVTFNGVPAVPMASDPSGKPLNSRGRTEILPQGPTWFPYTYLQITLEPGEYQVEGRWIYASGNDNIVNCTLTIVSP